MSDFSLAGKLKKRNNRKKIENLVNDPPVINENKILFYASNDFSDNARALYEYMVETELDKKYDVVWLVRDVTNCKAKDLGKARFVFVKDDELNMWTWEAQKEAMSARWLFFTHSLNWVKVKRPEQTFVNLWHGCGYKGQKKGQTRNTYFDYSMVTGEAYVKAQSNFFGCSEEKLIPIGNPRLDWMRRNNTGADSFCSDAMQKADCEKLILWMPTFRSSNLNRLDDSTTTGEIGLPLVENEDYLQRLNSICMKCGVLIMVKSHNLQKEYVAADSSNILFVDDEQLEKRGINLYELIVQGDALISDYSSVAVDYLLVDKPEAFILDDFDEFSRSRGWVFDNAKEYMPGNHIYTFEDMEKFIKEVSDGKDRFAEQRRDIRNKVHVDSDCYCRDIIDFLGL